MDAAQLEEARALVQDMEDRSSRTKLNKVKTESVKKLQEVRGLPRPVATAWANLLIEGQVIAKSMAKMSYAEGKEAVANRFLVGSHLKKSHKGDVEDRNAASSSRRQRAKGLDEMDIDDLLAQEDLAEKKAIRKTTAPARLETGGSAAVPPAPLPANPLPTPAALDFLSTKPRVKRAKSGNLHKAKDSIAIRGGGKPAETGQD